MNWNIFKRLRNAENAAATNAFIAEALRTRVEGLERNRVGSILSITALLSHTAELENRIYFMEQSLKPAVIKTAAERLTKAQAYRRDYYQKRKAAMAKLAELKGATK